MNPWLILAVVLAIGGAGVGGYFKGQNDQENSDKAARVEAVDLAIEEANRVAEADKRKAVAAASRRAAAKTRTITIQGEAREIIREVPMPAECNWDDRSFGILRDAISASNDQPASPGKLPVPVSAVANPGK